MRRLHYAGGSVLTTDRTCKAVLRYARALAEAHSSDVVSVPVVQEGGTTVLAHFLIGPASQLYSTPVLSSDEGPDSEELIAELEARSRRMHPGTPAWPDEMQDIPDPDMPDFELPQPELR